MTLPSPRITLPDVLVSQPYNQEPAKSGRAAFPQRMSSLSRGITVLQTPDLIPPRAKSDRKLRKGKGRPQRKGDVYKNRQVGRGFAV